MAPKRYTRNGAQREESKERQKHYNNKLKALGAKAVEKGMAHYVKGLTVEQCYHKVVQDFKRAESERNLSAAQRAEPDEERSAFRKLIRALGEQVKPKALEYYASGMPIKNVYLQLMKDMHADAKAEAKKAAADREASGQDLCRMCRLPFDEKAQPRRMKRVSTKCKHILCEECIDDFWGTGQAKCQVMGCGVVQVQRDWEKWWPAPTLRTRFKVGEVPRIPFGVRTTARTVERYAEGGSGDEYLRVAEDDDGKGLFVTDDEAEVKEEEVEEDEESEVERESNSDFEIIQPRRRRRQ